MSALLATAQYREPDYNWQVWERSGETLALTESQSLARVLAQVIPQISPSQRDRIEVRSLRSALQAPPDWGIVDVRQQKVLARVVNQRYGEGAIAQVSRRLMGYRDYVAVHYIGQ
jgi:hypothetical protein